VTRPRFVRLIAIAAAALVVAALPRFLPSYVIYQLTYVGAYTIAIVGLILLTGMSGQISLGHGAFVAGGGYVAAILVQLAGVSYVVAIPLAALVCGLFGLALGFIALRLEGLYLALATFALAVAVPPTLKHFKAVTGGVQGISLPPFAAPAALHGIVNGDQWLYLITWGLAGSLLLATSFALRGRLGRSLRALRDHPIAAASFGVDPTFHKTLAFAWSAAYAGIAGALLAFATAYVSPDAYGFALSLTLLAGAVLGGLDTLYGALAGGIVVEFLPFWAQRINPAAPSVVYGIALVLVMVFMPVGIAGAALRLRKRHAT
jgi:branched-chain amino acid transport system permease protein